MVNLFYVHLNVEKTCSNMTFNNEHFCFHVKSSNFQTFSTAGNGSPKNKLVKCDEFQFHEFFTHRFA